MSDLIDMSFVVTRPSPATALELNDGTAYEIAEWNPPLTTWRRKTVEGTYTPGRRLVSAVPEAGVLSFAVRVKGATWDAQNDNSVALFAALSQFTYTATSVIEGVSTSYRCEPADISLTASGLDPYSLARGRQVYVITIPALEV